LAARRLLLHVVVAASMLQMNGAHLMDKRPVQDNNSSIARCTAVKVTASTYQDAARHQVWRELPEA